MTFSAVEFIQTRRLSTREHTDDELAWFISSFTNGTIPDYQVSAWLMAVCLNGLSERETATLTRCMTESGVRIQWRENPSTDEDPDIAPLVDKHSSGGIGDKISIVLAPLVASFGVAVPMMAGRGLGHTGGTIDKLESIPGFSTNLSVEDVTRIVRTTGCVITTTGPTLCPADQKMYALRDVTATVSSIPLQTASILCKKIAENPDSLVLDVKYGVGAFQATCHDAEQLAKSMVATGEANGLNPTTAFLTRMDHPIGRAVGNWLEVQECMDLLKGWNNDDDDDNELRLCQDLITLVIYQAGQMLHQSGRFPDRTFEQLVQDARQALQTGQAMPKFEEMVTAQGGDLPATKAFSNIQPKAHVRASQDGYLSNIHALRVGQVAVQLGAGRRVAGEPVDPFAGIWFHAQTGDWVTAGTVLADVYCNNNDDDGVVDACVQRLEECFAYAQDPVVVPSILTHRVTTAGTEELFVETNMVA
jgi:pyrimidine-nucleoside phosphorylase